MHSLDRAADERHDGHAARRLRCRRLVVVDRRAPFPCPAILLDERIRIDHAAGPEDRIGRVADEVVVAVLAFVVRPVVALFRRRVVPHV